MKDSQRKITVAERLAQCLVANGVSHVFCVPGESYLALLDALGRLGGRIRIVTCRHEAGAANMAVAYGKLTGKPGICMVTRGPGATHASIGVHTARQDSVPMILFVGQVARGMKGRDAFQEVDYAATFGNLAKLAVELDDPLRVTELASRAFAIAQQGRRGPVVVALPEDVLEEDAGPHKPETVVPARAGLGPQTLRQIGQRMEAAERPLLILGGTGWTAEALAAIAHWAQAISLPIALSFRRKDLIDNEHPCYVGDLGIGAAPALLAEIGAADLVLALGARLGEIPSQGYTLFEPRETARKLIHIHPGAEEIGRVWPASLSAVCDVAEAAHALATLAIPARDRDRPAQGHAEYIEFSSPISVGGEVNLSEIVAQLSASLPPDAILCNGAGNYAAWLHRFFPPPGVRHAARPDQRRDGLRRSGGDRGQAAASRPHGRRVCGRRMLPHGGTGVRDCGSIWRIRHHHRRRQRILRHYPDAPGARISRPCRRDGAAQPRLRGLCTGIRRMGRDRRKDSGFPRCFSEGAGRGPARHHPCAHCPGRHRPRTDDFPDKSIGRRSQGMMFCRVPYPCRAATAINHWR
ncbi:MAG: thiamine pyrophosphate-binding protein [Rhizomicrobium sp.]